MSHLSILPTVLRHEELLVQALQDLSLPVEHGGALRGFADQREPVLVRAQLPQGLWLGWARQPDGSLALVGDLQRLGRSTSLQQLIGQITRRYAAHLAVRDLQRDWSGASVELVS